MKYYLVLVTGGEYFLTPCVIIKAKNEETAVSELKAANSAAYRTYGIALDRITVDEVSAYADEGAHVAETPEDITYAF